MNKFEQVVERLDRHIWYMSHRAAKSVSGMDADDLHQTGLVKLYEVYCNPRYADKPQADFDNIFKRCLFNAFADIFEQSNTERSIIIQDVDLQEMSDVWGFSAFDELYLMHYQRHLETLISSDAAILLEHLLNPTPAIYHMHNIQRMRREALQAQGIAVRIPTKITQTLVGQVLGFGPSKTKFLIREIRNAWTAQCQHSLKLNAVTS